MIFVEIPDKPRLGDRLPSERPVFRLRRSHSPHFPWYGDEPGSTPCRGGDGSIDRRGGGALRRSPLLSSAGGLADSGLLTSPIPFFLRMIGREAEAPILRHWGSGRPGGPFFFFWAR